MVGRLLLPCDDLDANLSFFTEVLGLRIERISPADDPREVDLSGGGLSLRLVRSETGDGEGIELEMDATIELRAGSMRAPNGVVVSIVDRSRRAYLPELVESLEISRLADSSGFGAGRAGMGYRDLIPSRLGGRFIASHIRIEAGGPVGDYPHFHQIRFQLIYCRRGWVRVVYEDQGEPFLLEPGDCVIQPPAIRHQVLECSPGLEVIEIGCPAEHDTLADHNIVLPTGADLPQRDYGGQRFVRHIAATATWKPWRTPGFVARHAGVAEATDGLAGVRTLRPDGQPVAAELTSHRAEFMFFFVLEGGVVLRLASEEESLVAGDSVTVPSGLLHAFADPTDDLQLLEVTLPAVPDIEAAP